MSTVDSLPHEVVQAIQNILPPPQGDDPLDNLSSNFEAVHILNDLFPDEASLGNIGTVQARLAQDEALLKREIASLQEELKRDQDPGRMHLIQEMISDLLGQMSRIREKATESEAVVRNITKDIQVLDLAKKNLILSMTTLKRLQMLVNALTQLDDLVRENKYEEIAQTLSAVKQIAASFKGLTSVKHISQVWTRMHELQGEIRAHLDADFDLFYIPDPLHPVKPSQISAACAVADVLGPDVRIHYITRYVALSLKEYRRIFKPTDEAGGLDNISRRFAWFRRLLGGHEAGEGRVFPIEWRVDWELFAKFAEITRDDLSVLLSKAGSSLTVKVLLDTLQQASEFEASIAKKYATTIEDILKNTTPTPSRPAKSISSAFESHMGVFVDAQDKAISDMLAPHRKGNTTKTRNQTSLDATPRTSTSEDPTPAEEDAPVPVLSSSTELFYFYGQSLDHCAKLSTGKPLFDLCRVHKKWLKVYAEEILTLTPKTNRPQPRKSIDIVHDFSGLKQACLLINTADYCQTTALELEEKMREKVNEEFKDQITFQAQRDLFVTAISSAITALLREVESAADPALGIMARTVWSTLNQVSGQSTYVSELVTAVEGVVEAMKPRIEQKKYLRNVLDKASSLILTKFTNAIVKSRPLKEIGAEQLLIDLQAVKACLIKLPGEALATTSYSRALTKSTTRLEALLKVIVTPVDPPEGFILNYTLLIGDASFSNFQKILDLKGTAKPDQNSLLDSFLTITSTKNELETTSFLSSLDMDPSNSSQAGNANLTVTSPTGSRISLPLMDGAITPMGAAESIFAALGTPPLSGPPTGGSGRQEDRREVFGDFRRFVSGFRRDSMQPGSGANA
ncbi:hypothetical protein FIBSPDRAFT_924022 [Athelia psychrophila]|uniref:Uncharacterized protein n=1 Tax=Athelia psychrophila TaxID=1759441 RepID=A0A166X8D4_9AGAM|nr:hypothetical protein FIBSPDRAFT_924022 [Fibularhizoctonia sp. CBS 109695]